MKSVAGEIPAPGSIVGREAHNGTLRQVTVPLPDSRTVKLFALKMAGLALAMYLAYVVREIWLPLFLALLLAMVLDPVVDRMQRRGWSRTWATAFIFAAFVLFTGGLIYLATPFVASQATAMQAGFDKYFPDTSHEGLLRSFHKLNLSDGFVRIGVRIFETVGKELQKSSSSIDEYGMQVAGSLVWLVIIPVVAFYMLRDFHLILAKGLLIAPKEKREAVQTAVTDVTMVFGRYIRGLAIVSALNGVATWLLLAALGVPNSFLLGIIAGLLYSVPYIGAVVTVAVTAAAAFLSGGVSLLVTSTVASIVLHQVVFDQIITPRVLGGQVGLHPILSIIALLVGNLLLGIAGMLLAVPVAACIQLAVLSVVPKLGWEIEIQAPTRDDISGEAVSEEVSETVSVSATEQLRELVKSTVDEVEQQMLEEESSGE